MRYSFEDKLPDTFKVFHKENYGNIDFDNEARVLQDKLNESEKENDIQSYIKSNEKWFIPLSILKDYDFGHHFACVVPEYPLGAEYRVDYLLIGKNSLGYHYVFVEFEDVNVEYRLKKSNSESEKVRKGITQIKDWKRWLDQNKSYFEKCEGIAEFGMNIPSWCFKYCLVVSRRTMMDEISNSLRGELHRDDSSISVITYDRLVDNVARLNNGI